jgi:hypothetical protein
MAKRFIKTNPKGEVLPHPHAPVRGRPVHGATSAEHEEKILSRHGSVPGRQPTPRKR